MDDGRSGKQNQRKVAEELKGLIKAVKDVRKVSILAFPWYFEFKKNLS